MTHIIRQYIEADSNGVLSSWENANRIAHPFLSKTFVDKVRNDIPNLYIPNAETWVAEVDGQIVGFISLIGNEVGALFVEPEFHGIGIGRALMDKAQSLHEKLDVEVFKENTIGRKFYTAYGFEFMLEKKHEESGEAVIRLRYQP